jgi:hypothetical protein
MQLVAIRKLGSVGHLPIHVWRLQKRCASGGNKSTG